MKFIILITMYWILACSAQDFQNRSVVHAQTDINSRWFVPAWSIGNLKTETQNNVNMFAGIGYRAKEDLHNKNRTWWVEVMEQEQWRKNGHFRSFDFRYYKNTGKGFVLYVEPSIFKGGIYESVFAELLIGRKISVGVETENVHHKGPDIIQVGPRVSRLLGKLGGAQFSASAAYRFHVLPGSKDELRLYIICNFRFNKRQN